MMKWKCLFMFLSFCWFTNLQAQEVPASDSSRPEITDTIRYILDPQLNKQLEKHKETNRKQPTVAGFRVQVYSGSNRQQAMLIRTEVLENYPEYAAYLIYKQPNFRVRVGDFKNRFEAQKLLDALKPMYPASFIVPDEVLLNPVLSPRIEDEKEQKEKEQKEKDAERSDP
ncbi:MAG: SPOR domain-containing protein [Bacteroidia bacterium]